MTTGNKEQTTKHRGRRPNPEGRGAVVRIIPAALVAKAKFIADHRGKGWTAGRVIRKYAQPGIDREYDRLTGAGE